MKTPDTIQNLRKKECWKIRKKSVEQQARLITGHTFLNLESRDEGLTSENRTQILMAVFLKLHKRKITLVNKI